MAMEMTIWKNFMTMPTTAVGICAYCAWPNTGSSAPYLRHILSTAAMENTMLICDKKLVMPSGRNARSSSPRSRKLPRCSRTAFMCSRYAAASTAERIWPMTVATAAPIMPQRKPKMKTGSRIMFSTAPARVEIMANRGLPSARMMGFMACPNI